MRIWVPLLLPLLLAGQTPERTGTPPVLRGAILERDEQSATGEFSVRTATFEVFRFRFDAKTYVERDEKLIEVARLHIGDRVEVVSDVLSGSPLRYARTIHVLPDAPPPRPSTSGRYRADRSMIEREPRTGNLTLSGVVSRVAGGRLVLHTRDDGQKSILLRADTRYVSNGELVTAAELRPNMRVFVRAGKDLQDQVEAYQVIWGSILTPR